MRSHLWLVLLVALSAGVSGCFVLDWLEEQVDPPPPKHKIGERTLMVLPFASDEALRRERDIEREVGAAVTGQLQNALIGVVFVSADAVHEWKKENKDWQQIPGPDIGRALKADIVIEVNIVDVRTRERADSALLQGTLTAEAIVSEVEREIILWRSGRASVRWPRHPTHTVYDTTDEAVKSRIVSQFAERLTNAFLDRFEP